MTGEKNGPADVTFLIFVERARILRHGGRSSRRGRALRLGHGLNSLADGQRILNIRRHKSKVNHSM
jgi:hypothetical protein